MIRTTPVGIHRPGAVHLASRISHRSARSARPGSVADEVIGEDGEPVERGKVGELCLKGPGSCSVITGIRKPPPRFYREGWLRSGDMPWRNRTASSIWLTGKRTSSSPAARPLPGADRGFLRRNDKISDVAVIGLRISALARSRRPSSDQARHGLHRGRDRGVLHGPAAV
jgi:acyl-CoA synthetase (AMP-forming)/AMP-acid ligase II